MPSRRPIDLVLALTALAAAACDGDPAAPDAGTAAPTYWQDVEPIFYTSCMGCHTAGGIAPFAIDDPDTAVIYAPAIVAQTAMRTMPPWPPGGDTPPLLHARTLTQQQIDMIGAWAIAGAPLGDPTRPGMHVEPEIVDIGTPELAFDIGVDYVPDAALSDDYRCFLADTGAATLRMATGYQVTPDNRATVHHVIVTLYPPGDRADFETLDAQTPARAGWPCVGGPVPEGVAVSSVGALGGWVPGVSAVAFPAGTGQVVIAGALAVIQVHYNLHGGTDPDRTRVEVALAPPAETGMLVQLGGIGLIRRQLDIPAGQSAVVQEQTLTVAQWRQLRGQVPFASGRGYAVGVGGHMHLIGSRIEILRRTATGADTVLLDIPRWSFHWQGQYTFATPIELANDDTLTIRCEYDNSDANRLALGLPPAMPVTWGEGTTDEMCLASLRVVENLP